MKIVPEYVDIGTGFYGTHPSSGSSYAAIKITSNYMLFLDNAYYHDIWLQAPGHTVRTVRLM